MAEFADAASFGGPGWAWPALQVVSASGGTASGAASGTASGAASGAASGTASGAEGVAAYDAARDEVVAMARRLAGVPLTVDGYLGIDVIG
jgi:hypothetical protein